MRGEIEASVRRSSWSAARLFLPPEVRAHDCKSPHRERGWLFRCHESCAVLTFRTDTGRRAWPRTATGLVDAQGRALNHGGKKERVGIGGSTCWHALQ